MTEPVIIPDRFAVRRRTAASWTSVNEVLYLGEIGLERDTGLFKFGNGVDPWNSLPYAMRDATLTLSDITTNNATTSRHGFLKKLSNVATEFINGQGNWATPSGVAPAAGFQVGYAYTPSSTTASTTSVIPQDNTIPQNTEGAAYASLDTTITPSSSTSLLEVEVYIPWVYAASASTSVWALFRDSGANAIQTAYISLPGSSVMPITLKCVLAAGSVSATTFKLRYGAQSAALPIAIMGGAALPLFGGSDVAHMMVREIKQ